MRKILSIALLLLVIPALVFAGSTKYYGTQMVNETRTEFRAIASNRGAGWRQQDFYLVSAIQLLCAEAVYMTYRDIENFFGNVWKWVDGINVNNNIPYVSNTDYYYQTTGWRVVMFGGNAGYGSTAGAFYVNVDDASDDVHVGWRPWHLHYSSRQETRNKHRSRNKRNQVIVR